VLIADDHAVVREGLKRILGEALDMEVVAEAATGEEVLERLESERVDVLLLDLSMPGPGAFELLKQCQETYPDLPVLVISVQPEAMYAVRALKRGAAGYVSKDRSPEELAWAIRRVHSGGRYVSEALAERLAFGDDGVDRQPHETLSNREYQVLCQLSEGRRVMEIAVELGVSPKTVSTYRTRILEKLGVESTADLIRYAMTNNLVS
jgi:DNA-binding NarL/FixJ family response regulator